MAGSNGDQDASAQLQVVYLIDSLSDNAVLTVSAILGRHLLSDYERLLSNYERRVDLPQHSRRKFDVELESIVQHQAKQIDVNIPNTKFVEASRQLLRILAQEERFSRLVDIATAAVGENPVNALGWGDDASKVVRAIGLTMVLLLTVSKLSADIDLGSVHAKIESGIPQGYAEIAKSVGDVFGKLFDSTVPHGTSLTPSQRVLGPAVLSNSHADILKRSDAIELRNQLWLDIYDQTKRSTELPYILEPKRCWTLQETRESCLWPTEVAYRVDVGVFASQKKKSVSEEPGYRVSVRLQTPYALKKGAFEDIRAFFKERFGHIVSVRRIGEVRLLGKLLASNSERNRWKGPRELAIGGQLSTESGTAGALTLFVKRSENKKDSLFYALGAGHVLTDHGQRRINERVFCPAAFESPANPDYRIGMLSEYRLPDMNLFDVLMNGIDGLSYQRSIDAGIASLTRPLPNNHMFVPGVGTLAGIRDVLLPETDDDFPVIHKSAAASNAKFGWLTGEEAIVNITLADYRVVTAIGLREVTARGPFGVYGDSGALCLDHERYGCGMLVAGTPYGEIVSGRSKGAYYLLPLASVLRELNVEPV